MPCFVREEDFKRLSEEHLISTCEELRYWLVSSMKGEKPTENCLLWFQMNNKTVTEKNKYVMPCNKLNEEEKLEQEMQQKKLEQEVQERKWEQEGRLDRLVKKGKLAGWLCDILFGREPTKECLKWWEAHKKFNDGEASE